MRSYRFLMVLMAVMMLRGELCHAQNQDGWQTTETGIQFHIDQAGQGHAQASINDTVVIRFVGRVEATGEIFGQTPKDQHITFKIGQSNVMPGIQLGLLSMRVGEHRTLKIPAKLGFANNPHPKVPINSDLLVTLELLNLFPPLQTTQIKPGHGPSAKTGDIVTVHYVGKLADQTIFDSSRKRDSPFEFGLGSPFVIAGWNQGVRGMKIGEIRTLTIPPHLAYGKQGKTNIPPNSTLHFEIELLEIQPGVTWETIPPTTTSRNVTEGKSRGRSKVKATSGGGGGGIGKTLIEGGTAKIHLQLHTLNGATIIDTQFSKPILITVNAKVDPIGLAIGVLGMKENEVRQIHIPPMFGLQKNGAYRNKHLIATVDLVKVIR